MFFTRVQKKDIRTIEFRRGKPGPGKLDHKKREKNLKYVWLKNKSTLINFNLCRTSTKILHNDFSKIRNLCLIKIEMTY